MKTLNILIGVAGVGKSTYINKNKKNQDVVISSDEIRKEFFGKLSQEDNQMVFSEVNSRILNALKDSSNKDVFYDATNLSRRKRKHLYEEIKRKFKDVHVKSVLILKPLQDIIEQNSKRTGDAKVPNEVIKKMYKQLQIPRTKVDCDEVEIVSPGFVEFYEKDRLYMDIPHDSCYHKESVYEHIVRKMCQSLHFDPLNCYTLLPKTNVQTKLLHSVR